MGNIKNKIDKNLADRIKAAQQTGTTGSKGDKYRTPGSKKKKSK